MGYIIGFILGVLIFFGAYMIWTTADKNDLQTCKDKYGSSYTLGHSSSNSSIKWCVSPDGVMKAL